MACQSQWASPWLWQLAETNAAPPTKVGNHRCAWELGNYEVVVPWTDGSGHQSCTSPRYCVLAAGTFRLPDRQVLEPAMPLRFFKQGAYEYLKVLTVM